jgi:Do/DeqQ family serine protease
MKQFLKLILVAIIGGLASITLYTNFVEQPTVITGNSSSPVFQVSGSPAALIASGDAVDFTEAAKRSVDAVVHVTTTFQPKQYYNPWSQFFGGERYYQQQQKSTGSGVIVSGDGYIVTNNHVVSNAADIEITTNDNRTYKAKLIGADPATDLALLKIEEKELPAIILGDSDFLQIGEWVLAVGNPFNLTSTVTAGIVSAKARNINILNYDPTQDSFPLESFIQTDAAVNPGNSGGALVNKRGELVGINTAIASQTGSYSGYSFAIPVSIVQKVTADLLEFGKVQRAYIGVNISNIDPTVMADNKLKISEGAYVQGLLDGGAASDAGLKSGDVITGIEGRKVRNVTELQEQIGKYRPGDKIDVEVLRDNDLKLYSVTLRDRFGNTDLKKRSDEDFSKIFGATLVALSDEEKAKLNIANGVKISEITTGKLLKAGVPQGFIITHIDKQPVSTPDEVYQILKAKTGGVLVEGVNKNGIPEYFGFGL